MSEIPERDPLADLVSRGLGIRVESVFAEPLPFEGLERRRLRYAHGDAVRSVIFERAAPGVALEAQLLPFLARKTERVPLVHARGLPPPHARLGPWLLLEDVVDAPAACDDPGAVVRAKLEIEGAVARDLPALRALGVPERPQPGPLASAPVGLVHGALTCARARRVERGVVLVEWSHAFLGPTVIDAASLARDLERSGDRGGARLARATYASATGDDDEEAWCSAMAFTPAPR